MQHVSQQNSNVSDKMMPPKQEIYVMSKNHSIQLELENFFSNIYYYMHFFLLKEADLHSNCKD